MDKWNYYKWVYFPRFWKVLKNLKFLKFISSVVLILIGLILIRNPSILEIASIIAGTGFALLISVIFDYFEYRKKEQEKKELFVEELGVDIEKARFYKFSNQFKESIISRILYLNARPQPPFLREEGSIGALRVIRELTGELIMITESNSFVLKPLIDLSFSCMTASHGKELNKFHKEEGMEGIANFMNKQLRKTLESIFWSVHDNHKIEELFLQKINRELENYLKFHKGYTSPEEFISLYNYIANSLISHKGLARDRMHFKKNKSIYIFEGFIRGINLSINGLKNIERIFPDKRDKIRKVINEINSNLLEAKNQKKFKIGEINSKLLKEFLQS